MCIYLIIYILISAVWNKNYRQKAHINPANKYIHVVDSKSLYFQIHVSDNSSIFSYYKALNKVKQPAENWKKTEHKL